MRIRWTAPAATDLAGIKNECREPPEPDQPCLVFIQLQPILAQMLLQVPQVALCLVLALEAEDGIVGVDGHRSLGRHPYPNTGFRQ